MVEDQRQAGTEIKVSERMIAAGADALRGRFGEVDLEMLARETFLAMAEECEELRHFQLEMRALNYF